MVSMPPFVSRTRRLLIIGAVALPFLGLLVWSGLLIRATREAFTGFAHCSTWTLETSRHLEVVEDVHEKASRLLHAQNPAIETATLEAAIDRLSASRKELGRRTSEEVDPFLGNVDPAIRDYLAQVDQMRSLVLEVSRLPEGKNKAERKLEAFAAHAHLDHQHQTVLGTLQSLARYHKDMLESAIRASQRNATQLSVFAGVSLLVAIGFGLAGGMAFYQRNRSRLVSKFAQKLLDTIPDGVVVWNRKGRLLRVNPGMTTLLGTPSDDSWKAGNVRTLLPASTVDRLEAAGADETLRVNVVHASGALRAVDVRVGIVEEDGITPRIAVIRDVSNQVERERRLVEFQWQIQMGRQVTSVARDLERVLTPMFLAQEMILPGVIVSHSQKEAWRTIQRSAEQASLLLRQFSRMAAHADEPPDVRVFDLQACLMEVIESFHLDRQTMAGIEIDMNPAPCPVRGPINLVRRSFELLIQRGLDSAGGKTPIQVRSQQVEGIAVIQILDPGDVPLTGDPSRLFDPVFCLGGSVSDESFGLFNVAETLRTMGGMATATRATNGWMEISLHFPMGDLA